MKRIKGSVSIYLCIILLSVITLISVLAERARVSTIQAKSKAVTYMATESVLAGYGKQIFKDYGLLLAWENISVEESLKKYMQANINKADLKGTGTNFMDTSAVDIAECNLKYVTDECGKPFLEQVKKYIQYAGMLETADALLDVFSNYTENNNIENKEEEENITLIADKTSDELLSIVEKINEKLDKLKKVENLIEKVTAFKQHYKENKTKKALKVYKDIMVILKDKEESISELINLIGEYQEEKKVFLNNNGYTNSISDYMEDNLNILEKLKGEILKVEELNVSKNFKVNSQNQFVLYVESILENIDKLKTNDVTEKDKENASVFDSAKKLMNKGIVALVTESTKNISQNAISTTNLPSRLEENSSGNLYDKAMLLAYGNVKFGNFLETKKNTALKYEIEYLIAGESSDSDNLAETIKQIIAIRNVVNIGVLLADSVKMQEITTIATSVAAVTGLPFMEVVAKALLIEVLALAESIYEVKLLLKGGRIPTVKTKKDWNTDLDNLLMEPDNKDEKKGMDYIAYCNVILLQQPISKVTYRMMDLIQENVQYRYNSEFLMEKCFTAIEVKADFQIKPLFMAMPWTLNMKQEEDTYKFQILRENSY